MKPRVFVSSTYYDLKYLRERIELFLERFNFEPVLFESDKLTYEHGKSIDKAAYDEVNHCQMMVLIVGGRYGTPASSAEDIKGWRKKYDDEFVSITRKEYETALKANMPAFIFIDKNVYAEYQSFKENEKFFLEEIIAKNKIEDGSYKFAHVDNHNIFYFIDSINQKPVKTFEKIDEIENYLANQFSGMFFLYLKKIQDEVSSKKILDSVEAMNNVVSRMNEMVSGIGKKFLSDDSSNSYNEIVSKQTELLLDYFAEKISNSIQLNISGDYDFSNKEDLRILEETSDWIFSNLLQDNKADNTIYYSEKITMESLKARTNFAKEWVSRFNIEMESKGINISISNISFWPLYLEYKRNIKPLLNTLSGGFEKLREKLKSKLFHKYYLPF